MLEHPKLVAQFWHAEKNHPIAKQYHFLIKEIARGCLGIFEKETQGTKFHELENLEPCIFLYFTKLV